MTRMRMLVVLPSVAVGSILSILGTAGSRLEARPPEAGTVARSQAAAQSPSAPAVATTPPPMLWQAALRISTSNPQSGLIGELRSPAGHAIHFRSRVFGSVLRSEIRGIGGTILTEYVESGEGIPSLTVLGVPYHDTEPRSEAALAALAKRHEGVLVRELARRLVYSLPGVNLVRERRGLEVPYQAIQHYLDNDRVWPVRETEDYRETVSGYVVKTLDPRLIMRRNYAPTLPVPFRAPGDPALFGTNGTCFPNESQSLVSPMHDSGLVSDCFGQCGGGCGTWQDTVLQITEIISQTYHPPGTWGNCPVSGGWSYEYTGNCEHRACGCKTHGCAHHDWCVREICGGDPWNACSWTFCNINPAVIWTGISVVTCLWRSDTCWIHYGPCSQTFTSYSCANPCCESAVTKEEQLACGGCKL